MRTFENHNLCFVSKIPGKIVRVKTHVAEGLPTPNGYDYTLSLWDKLTRYCENGSYLIDDNPIENSIRPLVIARKNHLFAGSHEGAKRLAIVFSFTGSCKLSGINPQAWFTDVLNRIQDTKQSELNGLLPHNWSSKA